MSIPSPQYRRHDFNTVWVDAGQIKVGNSLKGHLYSWILRKPLIAATSSELEQVLNRLHEEAKALGRNPEGLKERKLEILKHFDQFREIFLLSQGASTQHLNLLQTEKAHLIEELQIPKKTGLQTAYLASDFEYYLHLDSAEHIVQPLTREEMMFADTYLNNEPVHNKLLTLFDRIRRETDNLETTLAPGLTTLEVNGKLYEVYDLSGTNYQFIGSAGKFSDVQKDYEGYQNNKWPYLCASLIDEEHVYFKEFDGTVFQILSVPSMAVVHTSHIDLASPWAASGMQPQWYALAQRAQVLSAHLDGVYHQFIQLQLENGQIPSFYTPIDKELRLLRLSEEWTDYLKDLLSRGGSENQILLTSLIEALRNPDLRKDREKLTDLLNQVKTSRILEQKDFNELEVLLTSLQKLEAQYPHFRERFFFADDYRINRVKLQNDALLNYYRETELDPTTRKRHYQQLFSTDDPTHQYNILEELERLATLLDRFPRQISRFHTHLNRFMGPQEMLSQQEREEYNEINLDMNKGGGSHVKAWLLSKDFIESISQRDTNEKVNKYAQLEQILQLAKATGIPVLIRSNPVTKVLNED